MLLRKSMEKALSLAMAGVAFSGIALGQVAGTGIGNAVGSPDVQVDADAAANVTAPPVDANASTDIDADGSLNNAADAVNGVQADVNATARQNDQNANSEIRSNVNAGVNGGVNGQQNRADASLNSSSQANSRPFGATFDSRTTDRLIIQDLQPNSTASRLGLRAGDRIVSVNGQTYTDGELFERDLARLNASTDVPIIYERDGRRYTQRFRMSTLNGQQSYYGQPSYNGGNYGSQGNGYFGQVSHSANRPMYGGSNGDMQQGQYGVTTDAGYGCGTSIGADCCGEVVQVNACYDGHGHHRHRHGRRHHRHHCR